MKLGRYDSFMIGIVLAFSVSNLVEREYFGIVIQLSILGAYFGIGWIINKFALQKDGE